MHTYFLSPLRGGPEALGSPLFCYKLIIFAPLILAPSSATTFPLAPKNRCGASIPSQLNPQALCKRAPDPNSKRPPGSMVMRVFSGSETRA